MILWKRALLLSLLSWLIPFAGAFAVFPVKQGNPPLFEAVMNLIVLLTAGLLFPVYFRARTIVVREAVLIGVVWLAVNLLLDYPLFAFGPMKRTAVEYYSGIGLDYLIYPLFALGAARLVRRAHQETPA